MYHSCIFLYTIRYVNDNEAPPFAVDGDVTKKWCATGNPPHALTIDLGDGPSRCRCPRRRSSPWERRRSWSQRKRRGNSLPKADFKASATLAAPGQEIAFESLCSANTETLAWEFPGASVETSSDEIS